MRRQSSATDRAMRLVTRHGYSKLAAARKVGIDPRTIYRAFKRTQQQEKAQ